MELTFQHDGKIFENFTPEQALTAGVPQDVIDGAIEKYENAQKKSMVRGEINASVGDTGTLIGTATDTAHLSLWLIMNIIKIINTASDLNAVKTGISPFINMSNSFLNDINNENVKLPFIEKGLDNVVSEIKNRATVTAIILTNNQ